MILTILAACDDHGGWFFGPLIFTGWLLIVGLLVFRFGFWRRRRWDGQSGSAVLAERYARGEIAEDEYRARLAVLKEQDK